MNRELVFVHGRSQEGKDAGTLKQGWIDAWTTGLAKNGLTIPIAESAIRFPYYGDTLAELVAGGEAPDVVVMGPEPDPPAQRLIAAVLEEARQARGITDEQIAEHTDTDVVEQGWQNWPWVRAIAKALDAYMPGASGTTLAMVTFDVYHYLRNPGVRDTIEAGVRAAISPGTESVVVGHSLGTIVSYNLLRREGQAQGWNVPLHLTLGSPLAVTAIRKALAPIKSPACARTWFNAMDPLDIVALYPLSPPRFNVQPAIENKTDVQQPHC